MARGAIWSPYYKITVGQDGADTVVEVNNIFHQSMAPVEQKEYFYQWPYAVFGDSFEDVLILGAGSGTDVAAALTPRREARRRRRDRPGDPAPRTASGTPIVRTTTRGSRSINDDARHFLRTTHEEVRPRGVRADRFADACSRAFRACGSRATCSRPSRSGRSGIT